MTTKTFIKGKDRDLESSITDMRSKLLALGFDIEEVSWLNPVTGIYSVHIRDKHCHALFTNGKGSSKKACLASALGEFFERLSCNYFFADYYLGQHHCQGSFVHYPDEKWFAITPDERPEALMNPELWAYFDPDDQLRIENLFDLNTGRIDKGVCALPFQRLSDEKYYYIPVNIIANIYVSNGMSAGNTAEEARVQALSEICERYVKNKIIAEGLCLPDIPTEVLRRFPKIMTMITELREHGYGLKVADASLEGQFPVISVTLINPEDGSVLPSFGAHPCFEVALERTLTELLQGRRLDQLNEFHPPTFDMDEVASSQNLEMHFIDSTGYISNDFFRSQPDFDFCDWNYDGPSHDQFHYLTTLIHRLGFHIYMADYTHLGVYACRIIVPGMSDIYPVDELLWENNNEGALYREQILTLDKSNAEQWQQLLQQLEDGAYPDQALVSQFIGILPQPDTVWTSLRLGELKALLCLALQDEQAIDWIDWCLSLGEVSGQRLKFYRCLAALLEIKWHTRRRYADYVDGLQALFGKQLLEQCLAMVEGDNVFSLLESPGLALEGFDQHQNLLAAYEKLQTAKIASRQA